MTPIFPDRIEGCAGRAPAVPEGGRDVRIEAGKRAEFAVPHGQRALLYVSEGGVRIEADDTQAAAGDLVWFQQATVDDGRIGLQADGPFRGILSSLPSERAG